MTTIQQQAPPIDAPDSAPDDAPWAELRDALVAIAVAVAGVASAVAIVIIPQLFPPPAQASIVCRTSQAQATPELAIALR